MVTKSNAQRYSYVLWDEVWEELRGQYADISSDKQHCDAAAMNFVRCPERFDVVVASNLFGDVLTDLGGILSGGLGFFLAHGRHMEGHGHNIGLLTHFRVSATNINNACTTAARAIASNTARLRPALSLFPAAGPA